MLSGYRLSVEGLGLGVCTAELGGREARSGDEGRGARTAEYTGHSGSRSGSFIADMQEESPCSTKICLYTNFFVTFFHFVIFTIGLLSACDTQ